MLIIGLTGGIGSGKTTVANLFAQENVPIIDADLITRELTIPNSPAYKAILAHFGDRVLATDGTLDRRLLRQFIFDHVNERRWLESLLHPLVAKAIQEKIATLTAAYCILVIPLLLEVGSYDFIDRILVVDVPLDVQLSRTAARDQSTREAVQVITNTQISRELRLAQADDIIINDGKIADLLPQIKKWHQIYTELAQHGDQDEPPK